jgi:hypothetical protein
MKRDCPVCESPESVSSPLATSEWEVVTCSGCGMTFLKNAPDQVELESSFDWAEQRTDVRSNRRKKRRAYYLISDSLKKLKYLIRGSTRKELEFVGRYGPDEGGNLLDLGCADGGTLKSLDHNRWVPFGVEPSPSLAAKANEYCQPKGGRVIQDTSVKALGGFEEGLFSCIMMRSYLEHEAYVKEVLVGAYRVMRSGACLIVKVPNYACWNARLRGQGWPGVRYPDHVNYFRPQDLRRAMTNAGFTMVRFPWGFRLPTSDNMWLVAYRD